ncbi:hypothetical protein FGG79_19175 [Bacillus sp. BHET2]|uniref:hypothetical protein n=1 Tax=Bacillus sp. BHET2 TaxID=2583818 RepID=UPI00110D8E2C|nr:hypothetical protein [Bacillus sp. BHET2]TMU83554.1 hypothetical protein FGG79_19175 [Bacillus sp. BHET2]
MNTFKELTSSFILIISWFLFAISAYLLYWTIIMPEYAIIPILIIIAIGLLCFYSSRKLDGRKKLINKFREFEIERERSI